MESCKNCVFYSQSIDELSRDYNDVDPVSNHYCPMYQDAISDGVFDGKTKCEFFERRSKDGLQS